MSRESPANQIKSKMLLPHLNNVSSCCAKLSVFVLSKKRDEYKNTNTKTKKKNGESPARCLVGRLMFPSYILNITCHRQKLCLPGFSNLSLLHLCNGRRPKIYPTEAPFPGRLPQKAPRQLLHEELFTSTRDDLAGKRNFLFVLCAFPPNSFRYSARMQFRAATRFPVTHISCLNCIKLAPNLSHGRIICRYKKIQRNLYMKIRDTVLM